MRWNHLSILGFDPANSSVLLGRLPKDVDLTEELVGGFAGIREETSFLPKSFKRRSSGLYLSKKLSYLGDFLRCALHHDPSCDGIAIEYRALGIAILVLGTGFAKELFEGQDGRLGIHFPKFDDFEIACLARKRFNDVFDDLMIARRGPGNDVVGLWIQSQVDVSLPRELSLQDIHRRLWIRATDVVTAHCYLLCRCSRRLAIHRLNVDLGHNITKLLKLVGTPGCIERRAKRVGRNAKIVRNIRPILEPHERTSNSKKLF